MHLVVEQLKELIKSYTIAQAVARASSAKPDIDYALGLLDEINRIRINLALQAEMRQIFYSQLTVQQAATADSVLNQWFSKNDKAWTLRRGIAELDDNARVSLLNQGDRQRAITRQAVPFQQLFSTVSIGANNGSAIPFDLAEPLRFAENQTLNIAITNQTGTDADPAYLWLHGAVTLEALAGQAHQALRDEIIDPVSGETRYLPETQLVPMPFKFDSATAGTYATDPSGNQDVFTVKNDRSVLLTRVGCTTLNCRVDKLVDEGRNQTICDRVEMAGIAPLYTNAYSTWYDLPYPHLLRRGDRLRANFMQGSLINSGNAGNELTHVLTFDGITL